MSTRVLTVVAAAAACVLFLASSSAPQDPAGKQPRTAYGDLLATQIGKTFSLTQDRSLAVRNDGSPFKLTTVGSDYVTFENGQTRVCVPIGMLRIEGDQ